MNKLLYTTFFILSTLNLFSQQVYKDYLDGEIYVKYIDVVVPRESGNELDDLIKNLDEYEIAQIIHPFDYVSEEHRILKTIRRVSFEQVHKVDEFIAKIEQLDHVEYAEKIPLITPHAIPNDPLYEEQGYLDLMKAPEAWDYIEANTNIIVAIVDSSFDTDHEDLRGSFISGFNVTDQTTNVEPDSLQDIHGTLMAGIIGAHKNNEIGIAGLASGVKILPIKGLNHAYEGIFRAASQGAHIINCSWGHPEASFTINMIMQRVTDFYDPIIITSAGNDSKILTGYPSAFDGVITIATTFQGDLFRSWESNYGDLIDFCLPSLQLTSTSPDDNYSSVWGATSSACAMASAAFALVWSVHPTAAPEEVIDVIRKSVTPLTWEGSGNGLINLLEAVEYQYFFGEHFSELTDMVNIIPNPAYGYIRLSFTGDKVPIMVQIYQSTGNIVETYDDIAANWYKLQSLMAGNYYLRCLYEDGSTYTTSFVKL